MTEFSKVYDAFLAKILEDEWGNWVTEEMEMDMRAILEGAIPHFKFPRVSLDRTEEGFRDKLSSDEIQILATYMKVEWLNRSIMTWENVKPLYTERDFSMGNLLDKLTKSLAAERTNALILESNYYRSIKGRPFKYSNLVTVSED